MTDPASRPAPPPPDEAATTGGPGPATVDVVVVGGGPCGLTAALVAARRGMRVELVEQADRLGGMAASPTLWGQRVDLGSHRLHPVASPPVRALLDELLGEDLQLRRRRGRLKVGNRWVRFPLRPLDAARHLPPSLVVGAARDLVMGRGSRAEARSYAELVRAGLGSTVLERVHGPLAAKLWGVDPDQLSSELARKRIPTRSSRRLARALVESGRSGGGAFHYPRTGFGQIPEALARAAVEAGAHLRTGTRVAGMAPTDAGPGRPGVRVHLAGPDRCLEAQTVLWTASPQALASVVEGPPSPPPPSISHRGLVLGYLRVPEPSYSPVDAHYVPDPDIGFLRLSEPRNYRQGPDPEGQTVLCAEIPATPGDRHWEANEAEIRALVTSGMEAIGLRVPPVTGIELRRLGQVYPVLEAERPDLRQHWLDWSDGGHGLDGLVVLGRHGRVVADNIHQVMDMAISAVACLGAEGRWDQGQWEAACTRFETFVVED